MIMRVMCVEEPAKESVVVTVWFSYLHIFLI